MYAHPTRSLLGVRWRPLFVQLIYRKPSLLQSILDPRSTLISIKAHQFKSTSVYASSSRNTIERFWLKLKVELFALSFDLCCQLLNSTGAPLVVNSVKRQHEIDHFLYIWLASAAVAAAESVCSSGIYGILAPLSRYAPAQTVRGSCKAIVREH